MENENSLNRRNFVTRCAKLTAGITLLGSGIRIKANPSEPEDHAYCCYVCGYNCPSYINSCNGCKTVNVPANQDTCTVRVCCREKGHLNCAFCTELSACNKSLWINYPSMKANALRLQGIWMTSDIKTLHANSITIFPNPAINELNIKGYVHTCSGYKIFNLDGKTLKTGKITEETTTLNISQLTPGNYILQLLADDSVIYSNQFIKQSN